MERERRGDITVGFSHGKCFAKAPVLSSFDAARARQLSFGRRLIKSVSKSMRKSVRIAFLDVAIRFQFIFFECVSSFI